MLDINLFRADKGGDPEVIRASQRARYAPVELVDEVIALDAAWREARSKIDGANMEMNDVSKEIGKLKKAKMDVPQELLDKVPKLKENVKVLEEAVREAEEKRDAKLHLIGNIVHESVPFREAYRKVAEKYK